MTDAGWMLSERHGRWMNMEPALGEQINGINGSQTVIIPYGAVLNFR